MASRLQSADAKTLDQDKRLELIAPARGVSAATTSSSSDSSEDCVFSSEPIVSTIMSAAKLALPYINEYISKYSPALLVYLESAEMEVGVAVAALLLLEPGQFWEFSEILASLPAEAVAAIQDDAAMVSHLAAVTLGSVGWAEDSLSAGLESVSNLMTSGGEVTPETVALLLSDANAKTVGGRAAKSIGVFSSEANKAGQFVAQLHELIASVKRSRGKKMP